MDICGQMENRPHKGHCYFQPFVDDFLRCAETRRLKYPSQKTKLAQSLPYKVCTVDRQAPSRPSRARSIGETSTTRRRRANRLPTFSVLTESLSYEKHEK